MLNRKKYLVEVQCWSRFLDSETCYDFDSRPVCVFSRLKKAREYCEKRAKLWSEPYQYHWEGRMYTTDGITKNNLQTGVSYIITEIPSI